MKIIGIGMVRNQDNIVESFARSNECVTGLARCAFAEGADTQRAMP